MNTQPARGDGNAVLYCEGAFTTTNGKTAHGLVRRSERYRVLSVVDSRWAGRDAGEVLDGRPSGIALHATLADALAAAPVDAPPSHFVMGLAPDGGRLPPDARRAVRDALTAGLHVVSGLHDFLGDDPELATLARDIGVRIHDVRRPPPRSELHFFTGEIASVRSLRVAMLGTDSAVGKRTTAWMLVDAFRDLGLSAELIGTGQTAWLQGARYGVVMDALVNDFVSGEIEHAILRAWSEVRPDVLVLEGQGSLMNPAYPGGFELLAAGRPHAVVLQHAPARQDYDGFPGHPLHPLADQIHAVELLSSRRVVAVTVNHEELGPREVDAACEAIRARHGIPALDPLRQDLGPVVQAVLDEAEELGLRVGGA